MVHAYCTYCSSRKKVDEGPLPALERYDSERIRAVYATARTAGLGFFILSGEFGLLTPETPIQWYDHLLKSEEVDGLILLVAGQLQQFGIGRLDYFTAPLHVELAVQPYQETIVRSCQMARVALTINEI